MSYKHLKIEAKVSSCGKFALLTCIEQTHKGNAFGECNDNRFSYFGSKHYTVHLLSDYSSFEPGDPAISPENYVKGGLPGSLDVFVNGVSGADKMKNVPLPIRYWPHVKAAVLKYNETFAEGAKR